MIKSVERERIVNLSEIPLIENMECTIDNMIPADPVMCKICQTVFCNECISSWRMTSSKCPLRCTPFITVPLKDKIFKSQLRKLKIKCIYEKQGCKTLSSIFELGKHQKYCDFRTIQCDKCFKDICLNNQINHLINECPSNKYNCFICDEKFNYGKLAQHINACYALNESSFYQSVKKIEKCSNCSLRYLSNADHVCLNKDLIGDIQKIVNWVNAINDFEKHIKKIIGKFKKRIVKQWNAEEIMTKSVIDSINENINLMQQRKGDDIMFLKQLNENEFIKKENKRKRTNKLLDEIESGIKLKNIELIKNVVNSEKMINSN